MKKLISHILIALTGILTVSCNAWLDVTPDNAIADDDLFSTGFGYRNALNGIYTNLASDELYGKQLSWGFLSAISQQYNQKAGTISPMYADASELIYNTVDTEPVVTAIWEKGYKVIANLNKLIEKHPAHGHLFVRIRRRRERPHLRRSLVIKSHDAF